MPAQRSTSSASSDAPARSPTAGRKAPKHKPKGIPRAKTGCYTCRIRRKKCDEDADDEGCCQTCFRLRLQCLGFGDKRPAWLKDQDNLTNTRNKIRSFLTQKGLLKGQTSVPSGRSDDDTDILVLEPEPSSARSASESPTPSLSLSLSSNEAFKPAISSARDELAPGFMPYVEPISDALSITPTPDYTIAGTSHNIYAVDQYPASSSDNPAVQSAYGPLYHFEPVDMEPGDYNFAGAAPPCMLPIGNDMDYFFQEPWQQANLKHYLNNVVKIQYLLADQQVFQLIWASLQQSKTAREGACLLSILHQSSATTPTHHMVSWLESNASGLLSKQGCDDDGDAFAALQVVSGFLFVGGRGPWQRYLDYAIAWVERLFDTSMYSPEETLMSRTELERFVIKTTMWFDVLGSVTQAQPPRLLRLFRRLFHGASIDDGQATASMIPIMGCEKEIVLALGEISALAAWKETERKLGRLSNPRLVKTGQEIENLYLATPSLLPHHGFFGDTTVDCRALTSAVFRASARVYLHTVLSGDAPGCPEIAAAVTETVDCLRKIPAGNIVAERSVVRMVVFSICLAGCMTDSREQRAFLLERLAAQLQGEAVGNCAEVRKVMQTVWDRRDRGGAPVSWREVMAESPEGLLLLV